MEILLKKLLPNKIIPYYVLIVPLLIGTHPTSVSAITRQQVTFYSEPNKGGTEHIITESTTNIPPQIANSQSFCVNFGLWKVTFDISSPTTPSSVTHYGGTLGTEFCRNRSPGDNLWTFSGWELVGEGDLEQSSLTLFDKGNYMGEPQFVDVSQDEASFPTALSVNSYFLTGTSNWAVWNETNYEGTVTCWPTVTRGSYGAKGVQLLNPTARVGSVRRGCDGDTSTTTRSPGGETGSAGRNFMGWKSFIKLGIILWGCMLLKSGVI